MPSKALRSVAPGSQGARPLEWPTWCLIAAIYGGFGLLSYQHRLIPIWLLPLLGGWFVCWHSQLQHEAFTATRPAGSG
jgi:hypothetical protein